MKIPLSYLKNYIDHSLGNEKLADLLTLAGLEVEGIHSRPVDFEQVVAAKILSCTPHPEADQLKVTRVFDGAQEFQVVCGADNCQEGLVVPFARVGAKLFKNSDKVLKIKKAKLRGVESLGMLCAKEELGWEEKSEGLLLLPENTPLGCPLEEIFAEEIMEIGFTPNLGYCASLLGIARELSALLSLPFQKPTFVLNESSQYPPIEKHLKIEHEAKKNCPRYACRLLKNVTVGPSPDWLKQFLIDSGLRPVNNVVDITNYVLLELGQPLHAFDYDCIQDHTLLIRQAKKGETLTTLDHQERELSPEHLVIADSQKPLALAGIMGGVSSEVQKKTQNVLLEAAYFHPQNIRSTSKHFSLQTDSSWRFERGCDPEMLAFALDRAAFFIQDIAGGELISQTLESNHYSSNPPTLNCELSYINQVLGTQLSLGEVESIFNSLEFKLRIKKPETLSLTPPSYRYDIQEKIDLAEEVGRIFGYNHLPRSQVRYTPSPLKDIPLHAFVQQLHSFFGGSGLREWVSNDLISPEWKKTLFQGLFDEKAYIHLLNPNSQDHSMMRPSLLPGMLMSVKNNFAHFQNNLQAYEIGKVHYKEEEAFKEKMVAGILLTGCRSAYWEEKEEVDFFDIKGIAEDLLSFCHTPEAQYLHSKLSCLHPHRQSRLLIEGREVGIIGELHPHHLKQLDLSQKVYYAEFNLQALSLFSTSTASLQFQALDIYPSTERDWTLLVDKQTSLYELKQSFESCKPKHLASFTLKDLFSAPPIPEDKKSLTFNFIYRDKNKTLTAEQVEKEHEKFKEKVSEKLTHTLVL